MSLTKEESAVFQKLREEVDSHGMVLCVCIHNQHLSRGAAEWLSSPERSQEDYLTVAPYAEGWWIAVPPLEDPSFLEWAERAKLPASLLLALRHAATLHARWVQFDRDGDEWTDDLPVFEW